MSEQTVGRKVVLLSHDRTHQLAINEVSPDEPEGNYDLNNVVSDLFLYAERDFPAYTTEESKFFLIVVQDGLYTAEGNKKSIIEEAKNIPQRPRSNQ